MIDLEQILKNYGVSKTVYSWRFPETTVLYMGMLHAQRSEMESRHANAWEKTQDVYDQEFFRDWIDWVEPLNLKIDFEDFEHRYPTAGSSEAIREVLAYLGSLAQYKPSLGVPTIHIFEGEYEGYKALAKPYGIRVVEHPRFGVEKSIRDFMKHGQTTEGHYFFLSQPSAIDGNIWTSCGSFLRWLRDHTDIRVALDLCYVGLVPQSKWFYPPKSEQSRIFGGSERDTFEIVDYVFMSLSKVFGVYYNRIGGVFSRNPIPGLWGNKWFKNLDSLYFGQQLMKSYGPFYLPNKYHPHQQEAREILHHDDNLLFEDTRCSDVILLSHAYSNNKSVFSRGGNKRFCMTPLMDLIESKK